MSMISLSGLELKKGCVHLYVGDGKGKTTAATGLATRFLGRGGKVLFCQFLKARATGELAPLEKLGAQVRRAECTEKFTFQLTEAEMEDLKRTHGQCLAAAAADAASGEYQLIVLDEVVDAVNCGAVALPALLELLDRRADGVEIVLTGRNPDPAIVEAADYYTQFVCHKHPYQKGVASRPGVEY